MLFLLFFLWLIPSPETPPAAESLVFQIIHNDEQVGELKAEKRSMGSLTEYENATTLHTRIITKVEISYFTKVVFDDGILESSDVTIKVNGRDYSHTQTQRAGSQYQFFKDGKLKKTLDGPITYSSIMLLFGEPCGVNSTYSEDEGAFHNIESAGSFAYQKLNAKGRASIYQYQDRMLQHVAIDAGLVEFEMALQE